MDGIQIIPMEHLSDVLDYFHGTMKNRTGLRKEWVPEEESEDFSDIRGQQHLKRAVEAAVTGRHHLLLVGSPGSGGKENSNDSSSSYGFPASGSAEYLRCGRHQPQYCRLALPCEDAAFFNSQRRIDWRRAGAESRRNHFSPSWDSCNG